MQEINVKLPHDMSLSGEGNRGEDWTSVPEKKDKLQLLGIYCTIRCPSAAYCDKSSEDVKEMSEHVLNHHGQKVFFCMYPPCGTIYYKPSELLNHLREVIYMKIPKFDSMA